MQPRAVVHIAHLGAEHLLLLDVGSEVVVHLGRCKYGRGERCALLISHAECERMAATHIKRRSELQSAVKEILCTALAE